MRILKQKRTHIPVSESQNIDFRPGNEPKVVRGARQGTLFEWLNMLTEDRPALSVRRTPYGDTELIG